jgi:hypothetical protein
MIRPVLALQRILFLEREGKGGCRRGDDAGFERKDYREFISRECFRIPIKAKS